MRKPRIANRNPVVMETYTRRYYRSHELPQVIGMTMEVFCHIYEQATGEKIKLLTGKRNKISVHALEVVRQVQAMKKEGKQLKGL